MAPSWQNPNYDREQKRRRSLIVLAVILLTAVAALWLLRRGPGGSAVEKPTVLPAAVTRPAPVEANGSAGAIAVDPEDMPMGVSAAAGPGSGEEWRAAEMLFGPPLGDFGQIVHHVHVARVAVLGADVLDLVQAVFLAA